MNLTVSPSSHVSGTVRVPGNKSTSHRAAIFGAMARGTTRIDGFLRASDTLSTLACLRQLGVSIELPDDSAQPVLVESDGITSWRAPSETLDCGNSGTTMRLLLGALSGCAMQSTLCGDESLSKRPMDRVQIPLSQMGAQLSGQTERCLPPITVCGGDLRGIIYEMPVASAQVKSAILLAGLSARGETIVIESAPTRDHTEKMLPAFGVPVEVNGNTIRVRGGNEMRGADVQISGDISSAAFFFVAAALRPDWEITVCDVGTNPTRTGILDVLQEMGAKVLCANERHSGGEPLCDISIRGNELRAIQIGGALIPRLVDELPVLALLATQATGRTVIRDAAEMRVKESDRIAVIARELKKLGARIEERSDGLIIDGPTELVGTTVCSPRGDHRIAMTLAVAGLIARGETIVENADAVASSFPDFAALLQQISA